MRGHGEGTISQRKDGRWEGRISLRDGRRKVLYAKTRAEVARKMRETQRALEDGSLVAGVPQRVDAYLMAWLGERRVSVRPSTYESYRLNVDRLKPFIGNRRLDELKAEHIAAAYQALLEKGLSPHSVSQAHRVLRSALRDATSQGRLGRNPLFGVHPPRAERRDMQILTADQVSRFLRDTRDTPMGPLWALPLTTGLRIGEASALQWGDIDWTNSVVAVRRTVARRNGQDLYSGNRRQNAADAPFLWFSPWHKC